MLLWQVRCQNVQAVQALSPTATVWLKLKWLNGCMSGTKQASTLPAYHCPWQRAVSTSSP